MSSFIRVLPDLLINQIAAGEVIEDPASIVKELIENALDAGAQAIDIELVSGGHRLIRVSDDGSGMSQDDAVLCFERHATSKIRVQDDLEKLLTMGFRGEALAAIAAVSKVTLRTSLGDLGILVEIHGGKMIKVEPCARSRGTTIEVRDLFFNTPARRKFQKSSAVSSSKIERLLTQVSLGHPQVAFSLLELEKKIELPKQERESFLANLQGRMGDIFGSEFAEQQLSMEVQEDGVVLRGYISPPDQHRPQRSGQILFINERLIQAPLVSYAVREAYSTRLPEGRHPLYVIHLTLPPQEIDVNVHPQKKEVRFRQEDHLKRILRRGILQALELPAKLAFGSESIIFPSERPIYADFQAIGQEPWMLMEPKSFSQQQPSLPLPAIAPKIIALVSHFLLVEEGRGITVVDLQKALERIMYDSFTEKRGSGALETQRLLLPLKVEMSKREADELRPKICDLKNFGIVIAEMGERLFSIEEIPQSWEAEQVVEALFAFLADEKEAKYPSAFRRCIKMRFLLQEAEEILRTLLQSTNPLTTPMGQPTMVSLEESSLRQLFTNATTL